MQYGHIKIQAASAAFLCLSLLTNHAQCSPEVSREGSAAAKDWASLLYGYITPQNGVLPYVRQECIEAGEKYLLGVAAGNKADRKMLDSSALLPASGLLSDGNSAHFPGSFAGCLDPDGANGRYCLITVVDYNLLPDGTVPSPPSLEVIREDTLSLIRNEHFIPDRKMLETLVRLGVDKERGSYQNPKCSGFKPGTGNNPLSGYAKVGKCVPKECSESDVFIGGFNFLYDLPPDISHVDPENWNTTTVAVPLGCHTPGETKDLTTGDIVMIVVICCFTLLIFFSTLLDVGINVMGLTHLPNSLLPSLQGFSAYYNTIKIVSVGTPPSDGSNLACINGLKYISISWIVLGHVLWEYCIVSGLGVLSSSLTATSQASIPVAFTAVWNGLMGVDTFFVIGGCLLSFHTLKTMDKAKGGNAKMWVHFYIHRYIRLTGVYAILIGLHATLLKFFATGPQSHLVDNLVNKCQKGWWTNLAYINNFAADIYGAGKADCINVAWYMAIDMQYFILTPLFLSILWRAPKAGYAVFGVLMTAGSACQIYFTYVGDEYFHGGFSYYVKPWNRSQPYLIGLMLGYLLHKLRDTPKLNISPFLNIWAWLIATTTAAATLYGVSQYNIVENVLVAVPCSPYHPPMADRIAFNGFGKIAWALSISWLILACVKGRGGVVNSFLSWSVWVPLARLQYCVYLLHRTIIYIVNSQTEHVVRYSHTILTFQFLSILSISTFAAFIVVLMFEAPIVQMEKMLWAALGIGKMPQKTKR